MMSNGTQMPIIVSDKNELRRCIMHLWPSYSGMGLNLKNSKKDGSLPHIIRYVDMDSPAQYAGILSNDLVLKVGNKVVENEKFDVVLKLIRDQLKVDKKVDLLVINLQYYHEFKRNNEKNAKKIDYNSSSIVSQTKCYESPRHNPNTGVPSYSDNTLTQNLSQSTSELAPEPRLCHLLTWSFYDGYGFCVAYNNEGCFVKNVEPDSPAQLGGLRDYDRIIEINGKAVNPKDRDYIAKLINKHKVEAKSATLKSQSAYSVATNKSGVSSGGSSNRNYLNLFVADPNTHKWLVTKRVDIASRNKSLKVQECFTPPEDQLAAIIEQRQKQQLQPSQLINGVKGVDRFIVIKKCKIRRLKGKEDKPLGFEMTKRGNNAHYISKIESGSAAALSGLAIDDYLIELNDKNVEQDENSLLREKIFRSLEPESGNGSGSGEFSLTTINKDGYEYCSENSLSPSNFIQVNKQTIQYFETPRELSSFPAAPRPSDTLLNGTILSQSLDIDIDKEIQNRGGDAPRMCTLRKTSDVRELGFSIARIKNFNEHIINDVVPGSLADRSGLKANDILLEVNGLNVENKSHAETVNAIIDLAKKPNVDINLMVASRVARIVKSDKTSAQNQLPLQLPPPQPAPVQPAETRIG